LRRTGVTYKPLREASPLTEIHLAGRRGDELPALRVFVGLALQAAGSRTPVRAKRSTA